MTPAELRRQAFASLESHPRHQSTDRISTPMANSPIGSPVPTSASSTGAWLTFSYAQFAVAALMSGLGLWFMPVDVMVKGYMLMASVFLVGSTFTLTKTVRDEHEARRFANRIEEARTEKLLMEVGRGG
jgi:hypothetical protein